ncbi:MAG: phosphoglycerate mutase, partial [Thermoleophilia bacterium]
MVAALLILDGASEPVRPGRPTSLERARTPALDALAADAAPARVRTVPPGLTAGSEIAIPSL